MNVHKQFRADANAFYVEFIVFIIENDNSFKIIIQNNNSFIISLILKKWLDADYIELVL